MPPKVSKDAPPKLKFQPKVGARRSKEDRAAQEKAEAERESARLLAAAGPSRGDHAHRGRGRGRGGAFRGGLSGWRNEIKGSSGASGFLGGPSHGDTSLSHDARARNFSNTTGGHQSRIDTNPKVKTEGAQTKSKDSTMKNEEDLVKLDLISDDDADGDGDDYKIDINFIGGIGDDEEKPVRIARTEHVDRKVGVNTDASSATSAKLREKAKEAGDGSLRLPSLDEIVGEESKTEGSKSKGKNVELLVGGRRWRGVYDDDEEERGQPDLLIKDEPIDVDSTTTGPSTAVQAADPHTRVADSSTREPEHASTVERNEEDGLPARPEKQKVKHKSRYAHLTEEPVLQTDEDQAEWARYKKGLMEIAEELGPSSLTAVDASGDTSMQTSDDQKFDRRHELTYWFQLPPRIPKLVPAPGPKNGASTEMEIDTADSGNVASSSSSSRLDTNPSRVNPAVQGDSSNAPHIKVEDDETQPNIPRTQHEQLLEKCLDSTEKEDFEGSIGTLTVYEDGIAILDWGGIEHVVGKGIFSHQLQEVLVTEAGSSIARSMGQLSGCFVVQPEWEQLYEAAKDWESSDEDE